MAQKLFDPLKKIPHQLQNLDIIKKFQGFTSGKHTDGFSYHLTSAYGQMELPTVMAFDNKLGLLALGTESGMIKIFGTPGVVYLLQRDGAVVVSLLFLPEEARLLSASADGIVTLFELSVKGGCWVEVDHVTVPHSESEKITCMGLGLGVIYIGFSNGTLRQIAIADGRMALGDDALTALPSSVVSDNVPADKRDQLGVDSPIVALELQPGGNHLLIAYSGGCVAIAIPQPIPLEPVVQPLEPVTNATAPTAEGEVVTPTIDDDKIPTISPDVPLDPSFEACSGTKTEAARAKVDDNTSRSVPSTPLKEKRATLKFKALTRSLRNQEVPKVEKQPEPTLLVPPTPRVSHLLLRDHLVEWATWRVTTVGTLSTEVVVAYGDGAFQVWPIVATVSQQPTEAIIVSMRDPPSTPYGPLPCCAIKKILIQPAVNGGILTAFSGGLPHPQFSDRHAVSVIQDHDHHMCFEFESEIKDFLLFPSRPTTLADSSEVPEEFITKPCNSSQMSTLLVLTQHELVAIDLTQPNWPAYESPYFNYLNYSPITTIAHLGQVSPTLIQHLLDTTRLHNPDELTSRQWPIWGGQQSIPTTKTNDSTNTDIIALGHTNGWISLWTPSRGDSCTHLGLISTSALFHLNDSNEKLIGTPDEVTWPPFRRVGLYARHRRTVSADCLNSDKRLAITHLLLKPCQWDDNFRANEQSQSLVTSFIIVAGGYAGQTSLWITGIGNGELIRPMPELGTFEPDISRLYVNLLDQQDAQKYVWKDFSALSAIEGIPQLGLSAAGPVMYPFGLVQLSPPSPITSIALEPLWNLLVVGSAYGFCLIDLISNSVIFCQFTFTPSAPLKTPNPVSTVQNAIFSRGRQITAGMRHSFRRLKQLRNSTTTSTPNNPEKSQSEQQAATESVQPVEEQPMNINETVTETQCAADAIKPIDGDTSVEPVFGLKSEEQNQVASEQPTETPVETESTEPVPEQFHLTADDVGSCPIVSFLFADTFVQNSSLQRIVVGNANNSTPSDNIQPATTEVSMESKTDTATIAAPNPNLDPNSTSPSLWVGFGNGKILAYSLTWPEDSGHVSILLQKELQLHHHSPILAMVILDATTHGIIAQGGKSRISCATNGIMKSKTTSLSEKLESNEESTLVKTDSEEATAMDNEHATNVNPIANQHSHQLLICTEEQVKLFSLPTLRAYNKHKFVDRLRLQRSTMHDFAKSIISTPSKQEKEPISGMETEHASTENEMESKPGSNVQSNRKKVTGFGLQNFVRKAADGQTKSNWNCVVTLLDGQTAILSLPNLRKVFKERHYQGFVQSAQPLITSLTSDTSIFWLTGGSQLLVAELGSKLKFNSLATPIENVSLPYMITIPLPEYVRRPSKMEEDLGEVTKVSVVETAVDVNKENEASIIQSIGDHDDTNHLSNSYNVHVVTPLANGTVSEEDALLVASQAIGDITLDSVKEYMNGDGTMTVKTSEYSTEKHMFVEGGKIVTTVHEVEMVDGKVTKDDTVKIITPGDPELALTSGSA